LLGPHFDFLSFVWVAHLFRGGFRICAMDVAPRSEDLGHPILLTFSMVVSNDYRRSAFPVRWVLLLFVLAVVVRVGWVAVRFGSPEASCQLAYPDEGVYWRLAHSLAVGEGLVDEFGYRATYMPGYPAFLSVFVNILRPLLWARLVQALLGAWVAPATFLLAWQWMRRSNGNGVSGRRPGFLVSVLAGLAAVFDPFLVFFSGLLLTETLFAAVLVSAWAVLMSVSDPLGNRRIRVAVGLGILLLLSVYLRPSAAILVLLMPVAVVIGRRWDRRSFWISAVVLGVVVCGLFPWALRNHKTIGQWRWLTTRGGISLYDGLRQGATGASDLAHTKTMDAVAGLSESQWDAYFKLRAWSAVRQDAGRVFSLAGRKFCRTWSLTPNVEAYRQGPIAWISAGWMILVLGSAVIGWIGCRRAVRSWIILLLPVVVFTLLHMVFVGSVRYRVPVMPMVFVLSASGLAMVWERLRKGQSGMSSTEARG